MGYDESSLSTLEDELGRKFNRKSNYTGYYQPKISKTGNKYDVIILLIQK